LSCPNQTYCKNWKERGFNPVYFCLCYLARAFPNYQPPLEHNPKTAGMTLPKDKAELLEWANNG